MELEMKLKELFEKNLPDIPLFYYPLTDSTNTRAIEYARSGKAASAFFIAREQTAGRGRRGRSFSSDPGGLYLTFLTKPDMPPKEAIMLTVFASVALLDTVFEFTGKMPAVKWVNDLIMNGKKLAGNGKELGALLDQLADMAKENGKELITIYYGEDVTEEEAEKTAAAFIEKFDEDSVMLIPGGQPVYYYIIAAE